MVCACTCIDLQPPPPIEDDELASLIEKYGPEEELFDDLDK
jgi:hypothetical protein